MAVLRIHTAPAYNLERTMNDVMPWRLNLLRAFYLLVACWAWR